MNLNDVFIVEINKKLDHFEINIGKNSLSMRIEKKQFSKDIQLRRKTSLNLEIETFFSK